MTDSTPSAGTLARTPPSTEPTPDDAFIFAGDVRILATHNRERTEGTASSDALCHASPVWKKILFPPWENEKVGDDPEVKEIVFTEDDSVALLLLLNIAHLKFRRIPDRLPYKLLLQVAILCDQYDCVDLVRPWLKDTLWLRDEQLEFSRMSQRQWLFIAWVFGRDRVFEQAAILLVKLTTRGSVWLTLSPMPPGIVESILSHRLRLIAELLKIPYDLLHRYEKRSTISKRVNRFVCAHHTEKAECDALIYGSLTLGLRELGLFPCKPANEVQQSVCTLSKNLSNIKIHRLGETSKHLQCGLDGLLDFSSLVNKVLDNPFDPVLDCHRLHMEARK